MQEELKKRNQYQVERILDSRRRSNGQKLYLIKWKGYSSKESTWEPIEHLITVSDLVREYQRKKMQKVVENMSKKIYKSQKIRKRFENMRKFYLEKNMQSTLSHFSQNQVGVQDPKVEQRSISSLSKRMNKDCKRSSSKELEIRQLDQKNENQISDKSVQLIEVQQDHTNNKNEEIKQIFASQSKQILQNKSVTKLRSNIMNSLSERQQNCQCEDLMQLEQIDDQQSQSQDLQNLIKTSKKVEDAKILFYQGGLVFQINYKSKGIQKQLKIRKEQLFKINPEWLNNFFQGFYF